MCVVCVVNIPHTLPLAVNGKIHAIRSISNLVFANLPVENKSSW